MTQERYDVRSSLLPHTKLSIERETVPLISRASSLYRVRVSPGVREQHWFHDHEAEMIAQYGGQWIAISGSTLVGAADSAKDVCEQARQRGVTNPAIVQVPERPGQWDHLIF